MRAATPGRRVRRPAVFAAAAAAASLGVVASGCGGSSVSAGSSLSSVASFVPSSAPVYAEVSTEFNGPQWAQVDTLAKKFPVYKELKAQLDKPENALKLTIVKPLLGNRAALGVMNIAPNAAKTARTDPTKSGDVIAAIGLTEGKGEEVRALLKADKGTTAAGTYNGVELFRNGGNYGAITKDVLVLSNAKPVLIASLDANRAGGDRTIAGTARVKDALGKLPSNAFAQAYVDLGSLFKIAAAQNAQTAAVVKSLNVSMTANMVMSASAEPTGVRFKAVVAGVPTQAGSENFTPKLAANVPSDAVAYLGFANLAGQVQGALDAAVKSSPDAQRQFSAIAPQVSALLGVSVDDLRALAAGEGAIVVTKGAGVVPGAALLLAQSDGARAKRTLDTLRTRIPQLAAGTGASKSIPPFAKTQVGGVEAWTAPLPVDKLPKGSVALTYAVDGNLAIVGDNPGAIAAVQKPPATLAKNTDYIAASRQVPESVNGVVWVDVTSAVALGERLAKASGRELFTGKNGPKIRANLAPLSNVIAWGTSGESSTIEAFATIR